MDFDECRKLEVSPMKGIRAPSLGCVAVSARKGSPYEIDILESNGRM